jgi:hypothetical protein
MVLFRIIVGFTHALDILSDFLMFLLPILAVRDLQASLVTRNLLVYNASW